MRVIADAGPIPSSVRRTVVAIGVFDGVHAGHQYVIRRAVGAARRLGVASVAVTFWPHPVAVLRPEAFSGYVMTLEHRLRCIAELGVDICYVLPFSRKFSRWSARRFITDILVHTLHACRVVVGEDFHFGRDRAAAARDIAALAQDIEVERMPTRCRRGVPVKTRLIRQLVVQGDLSALKTFLGRPYVVLGTVVPGHGLGRRLGCPTANLRPDETIPLPAGIYLARARYGRKEHPALYYTGVRPTVSDQGAQVVREIHLLDFRGSLYGRTLQVAILKKLRDDRRFPDQASLAAAIVRDVVRARKFFGLNRVTGSVPVV